jgi:dihydroflavonol-4-reductase
VRQLNRFGIAPHVLLRRPLPPEAWRGAQVEEVPGDLEALPEGEPLETLDRACEQSRTLIHLAARVNLSGRGADEMKRINEQATIELFRRARRAGVQRFVHVSTTGAIGCHDTPVPLTEEAPYNLARFRNPYFDTKRAAEDCLLDLWREAPEACDLIIVNPSVNIGPQGSFRRLARPRRRRPPPSPGSWPYRLICFWFAGGLNLVDVRDVARGILLAAARGTPGRRYILAGANLTVRELVEQLRKPFGTSGPRLRLPLVAVRAAGALGDAATRLTGRRAAWNGSLARLCGPYWFYDSGRARREIGYTARPIEETLRDLGDWVATRAAATSDAPRSGA